MSGRGPAFEGRPISTTIAHSRLFMGREMLRLLRQPWFIAITLVQPLIWLLLFGALFERIVDIPGFTGGSYIDFLAPGVLIMEAMFSSGWSGMGMINDLDDGVVDRMLVTPARRSALVTGKLLQGAVSIAIQSLIIVVVALIIGASFPGGVGGVVVLIALAMLLGAGFAAFSNGVGLLTRQEETLIGLVQFVVLPLSFLSSAFMQKDLMPGWMQTAADFNPVNWAVEAGRSAVSAEPDWGLVASRAGLLVALMLLGLWFATRAFRSYQRSV